MDVNASTEPGQRAGRREWIGLAMLALPTMLVALDLTVLYLALPHLSADLGTGSTAQLWVTDIYGFMTAGFLITMGTLGDRIGRRRLLLIGAAAFGVFSVLAAYSTSTEMLIATRAMLGIAGATLVPSILALIRNMFHDPKQRTMAIATWMSCFMAGTAIGPVIGGALLEAFWWGSVFLLGVPVMVLLMATGPLLLPEYRDPAAGRLDLTSVVLSLSAILPVIYGIKELAKDGLETLTILVILIGVALGVAFVIRQRRLTNPLLDLRLFSIRTFRAAALILMLGTATTGAIYLFVSQYLQLVQSLSPLEAGLWLVPSSVALVAGAMLAPAVAQRIGAGRVIAGGLLISAIGYLLLTQVDTTSGLPIVVVGLCIATFGGGPNASLGTDLVVGSVPPERAGSAAAVATTSGDLGIALGVAFLGSVSTAVYRGQINDRLPADAPVGAADATRDTLAGGTAAAEQLPDGLRTALLDPAREAFTIGFDTVVGISAALVVGLAVLALVTLRPKHADSDSAPPESALDDAGTRQPRAAEESR